MKKNSMVFLLISSLCSNVAIGMSGLKPEEKMFLQDLGSIALNNPGYKSIHILSARHGLKNDDIQLFFNFYKPEYLQERVNRPLENKSQFTPMHLAVVHDNWPVLLKLIEHGADLNKKDAYGQAPFDLAKYLGPYHEGLFDYVKKLSRRRDLSFDEKVARIHYFEKEGQEFLEGGIQGRVPYRIPGFSILPQYDTDSSFGGSYSTYPGSDDSDF